MMDLITNKIGLAVTLRYVSVEFIYLLIYHSTYPPFLMCNSTLLVV